MRTPFVTYNSFYCSSFTGHEHLYDFGLINMNGRMYDPLLSSFLSPDNYMQDPTSQQGFNRYAYCMYNPLKYVDPTGEVCVGGGSNSTYYFESNRSYVIQEMYKLYMLGIESHWDIVNTMINSFYTQGSDTRGNTNGSGNHGSGGGDGGKTTKPKNFSTKQLNAIVNSLRGKCVLSGLGSMRRCWDNMGWGETTREWELKEIDYYNCHPEKGEIRHGYESANIIDFITWDKNGKYNKYNAIEIGIDQIYNYMEEGWIVAGKCRLINGTSHYVNVESCTIYDNGAISINFLNNPLPENNYMNPYHSTFNYMFDETYDCASMITFIAIKLIKNIKKP